MFARMAGSSVAPAGALWSWETYLTQGCAQGYVQSFLRNWSGPAAGIGLVRRAAPCMRKTAGTETGRYIVRREVVAHPAAGTACPTVGPHSGPYTLGARLRFAF